MANKITIYPVDPQDMNDLGVRRFTTIDEATSMKNINAVYGKSGASVDAVLTHASNVGKTTSMIDITDLPSGGKMIGPATVEQLRDYINFDMIATKGMRKRMEIEQIIADALEMQRRGRPAPIPRPTYLAVAIRAIYDDIESWSSTK